MKVNSQISLYLADGNKYNELDITRSLIELYPELDKPIIFTENSNFPIEANAPIFIFDKNAKLNIIGNYYYITIQCNEEYTSKISEITKNITEYLKKNGVKIYRVGYVNMFNEGKDKIQKIKSKYFKEENVIKSDDFELSWLNYININNANCNCWQRYFINKISEDELNNLIDVNTKEDEKVEIDCDFITSFIESVDKYIKLEKEKND